MSETKIKYLYPDIRKEYLRNAEKLKCLYEKLERYFYVVQPYCHSVHIKQEIEEILEEQFKIADKARETVIVTGSKIEIRKFKAGYYEMTNKSYYKMASMIKSRANTNR